MLTLVHIWKVNMIGSHLEGEHAYVGSQRCKPTNTRVNGYSHSQEEQCPRGI